MNLDWNGEFPFGILKGKTITSVVRNGDEEIIFNCSDGKSYKMYHRQDCCESVTIEDIDGDLQEILIGEEVLVADVSSSEGNNEWGTDTWTFYKLATKKGWLTIRWYGESNGYYSESVDFVEL